MSLRSLLKKGVSSLMLAFGGLALLAPFALAQSGGLFDPLDTLKNNAGVNLVDFSQGRAWGNLPPETQDALQKEGYANLDEVIDKADAAVAAGDSLENFVKGLRGTTDSQGNLNENGERVLSEIRYQGESQLQAAVLAVVKVFRNLMGALAMVFVVVAGIQMILAQGDEGKITEQKHAILYAIIGLGAILLIERLVAVVYGVPGEIRALTPQNALKLDREIYGLVSYIKAIIGAIAIFMIVLSGFKLIFAQGEEDQMKNQGRAVLWTVVGLVLILLNRLLVENLFINPVRLQEGQIAQSNVQNVLNLVGRVFQFLFGFVGLVAFAALVYGAATLVANFGNEEVVGKAKTIIKNALIGIVIILSAFAIVSTVIL